MKKNFIKLAAFLLVVAGIVASCNPPEPDTEPNAYPKVISFTEYSLQETSCQWTNLPYNEKVIVINSSEALEKYLSCTEKTYPAVDFSKYSLLLTSGYVTNTVSEIIVKDLKQVSSHKYILNLDFDLKYKDDTEPWNTALMIEKLSDNCDVVLNLTLTVSNVILPIEVADENILDFFKTELPPFKFVNPLCFFTDIYDWRDTCILINNIYEFQQSYECEKKLPYIDFDKFTLIIGKKHLQSRPSYCFCEQKIVEDSVLTQIIKFYYGGGGSDMRDTWYHWGIYPKLPDKPFYVEFIQIHQ